MSNLPDLSTLLIHADDEDNRVPDVAPPINVATTFRYDDNNLVPWRDVTDLSFMDKEFIYSRETHPNCSRLESIFSKILDGHAIVYNSGLSAFFAALTLYNPKRIFLGQNYHGCTSISKIFQRNGNLTIYTHDDIEKYAQKGDLVHVETPVNPFGTSIDLADFVKRAHEKGAIVMVDATFAPAPLQYPWDFNVDIIMHSATKYFGGHSDLLGGILCVKDIEISKKLKEDRIYLGTIIGNLESFLLLRSLRTYEMRIEKQSQNVIKVVKFLDENRSKYNKIIKEITHSSLQTEPFVKKQLVGGYTPVFSIILNSEEQCKKLPSLLKYFHHATSLGGVESLIEWRAMSDDSIDQRLLRVSIGCENAKDLINDLDNALLTLQKEAN